MKTILAFTLFILSSSIFAQTWTTHNVGTVDQVFVMSFPTEDTGYVITNFSTLRKTVNGALSWNVVTTPVPVYQVCFLTGLTGFAYADTAVYRTVNGGTSWTIVLHDNILLSNMNFVNQTEGYLSAFNYFTSADSTRLYKTTDNGINWTVSGRVENYAGEDGLCFLNGNSGFMAYNYGIFSTTNSGSSFNNVWTDVSYMYSPVYMKFPNIDTGYATETDGLVLRSTNSGASWNPVNSPGAAAYSLYFFNGSKGFVCGGNGINSGWVQQTTDAGMTWNPSYMSTNSFYCMDFPTSTVGYAGGDNGTVIKYTDGPTEISESQGSNRISIFPNPCDDKITINNILPGSEISVKNISGQFLIEKSTDDYVLKLDVSFFAPGIYFVEVSNHAVTQRQKLVVY
ncbi:MAG: T9SS type A sorting domain-containing protein [Bacteroidia bacterium]